MPRREPICNDQYCENPEGYPTDLIESLLGQGNFPDGLFTGGKKYSTHIRFLRGNPIENIQKQHIKFQFHKRRQNLLLKCLFE